VFRPQHAALTSPEIAPLRGPVTHREFLGATVRYAVRIGDSEVLIETPFQSGSELRAVGDNVGVDLPPRRMLFLPA
jgi:iron(III) transport system ATP-binding protein